MKMIESWWRAIHGAYDQIATPITLKQTYLIQMVDGILVQTEKETADEKRSNSTVFLWIHQKV